MDLRIITADFPVIHINGASIDTKLYAHRTAAELDHPDGSVTWDKLNESVQAAINDKSPAAHTHTTVDVYNKQVVAYDLSYYMAGWEMDGIAIGVEDKQDFLALDKLWFTYKGAAVEVTPSSFIDWNSTAGEAWTTVDEKHADLHVYIYTGDEFKVSENEQARLDPILGNVNLNVLLGGKADKKHIHDAADIYTADGRALEQRLIDMGADTSELGTALSSTNADVSALSAEIAEKIGNNAIGTYCKYNLVAGITSQLYVAVAFPIPGVSKYALIVNGKQMGSTTAVNKPLKMASALSTTTKSYLCFMTATNVVLFYAHMNDTVKTDSFTTGILTNTEPDNPWVPEDDFE